MKQAFRLFKRSGVYYVQNNQARVKKSLRTTDKNEAKRRLQAYNETRQSPALNLEMAKVFLRGAYPKLETRTWRDAMDELSTDGKKSSRSRCQREMASTPFNLIRDKPIISARNQDSGAV
jgi:hypothetical protein